MRHPSLTGVIGSVAVVCFGVAYVAADGARPQVAAPTTTAAGSASAQASPADPASQRALLNRYCVSCHNEKVKIGGLALDTLDVAQVGDNVAVWEKAVRKLHVRAMPPAGPGRPRPDEAGYESLIPIWNLRWIAPQSPSRTPAGPTRSIGSIVPNTRTSFAICLRWTSTPPRSSRPTIRAMVSTT
jgi:cytochrome c551/c552